MAPTPSPMSASQMLLLEKPRAATVAVAVGPSTTSVPAHAQPPSIGKAASTGFRFSTGAPRPVASTSAVPLPAIKPKRPRPPSPVRRDEGSPTKRAAAGVKVEPERSPAKAGDAKGKGRATEQEIARAKEFAGQEKSLMNRLSGPSDQKAGLTRDPEEVKRIIYEASKGSPYFINEQRKDAELTAKVDAMVARLDAQIKAKGGNLKFEEAAADDIIRQLEKQRDLSQAIVVVDADAFYASCHELGNPELKGTAFAVGEGVLTTASYEARKYGCRSAQAGFVARKLCPDIKFLKCDFSLYTGISKKIMNILREYGPMSPASLDEAYCSITEYCETHGVTPAEAAETMRAHVKRETGCTVSAGVSSNSLISKIAADLNKPDGQCVVGPTREEAIAFMRTLPARRVPGIGRVTERWLEGLGVKTVGDIYDLRGKLYLVRKDVGLTFLLRAYLGIGGTHISVAKRSERKSVGREDTFGTMNKPADMYVKLREIADHVEKDLKSLQYSGRTVTLIFKLASFEKFTRATTIGKETYIPDADTLYREGKKMLDKEISERKMAFKYKKVVKGKPVLELTVRLLGLRVTNLRDDMEKGKSLDKWAGKSKPNVSKGKATVKLEPDLEWEIDPEEVEDLYADTMEVDDDHRPPASSDPLWAAIDGEDGDAYLAALESHDPEAEAKEHDVEEDEDYKPFFTAGPSMNSRLEVDVPAPEPDRLAFDSTATLCPMCNKNFAGSAAALQGHVDSHFEDEPPKKKSKKKPAKIESFFSAGGKSGKSGKK
ncbi:hypothetical protein RQP46_011226 [Phenoliferia psychrophenolica]